MVRNLLTAAATATVVIAAVAGGEAERPRAVVEVVGEWVLSEEPLSAAIEVRWASPDALWLGLGRKGVLKVRPGENGLAVAETPAIRGCDGSGCFAFSTRLANSSRFLLVGSPIHGYKWLDRRNGVLQQPPASAVVPHVVDLDLYSGRALILGSRWGDEEEGGRSSFSPDGAIAWEVDLGVDRPHLRPVFHSSSGPGAETMNNCGIFELGGVRYLDDGGYVLVPGSEPGVYHYGADGKLLRTWDSEALGIDADCRMTVEKRDRWSASIYLRNVEWMNRRRIVDEVLALPGGAGVVVREVVGGETHWSLLLLQKNGAVRNIPLPLSSPSPFARLSGDAHADRLAFVVEDPADDREHFDGSLSYAPRRLVIAELTLAGD